ncbi:MAG: hypothetical protein Q8940_22835, partial [Bacteroidota bacterium]|nr:hypothetical protein [Bacteroidota bacterium]
MKTSVKHLIVLSSISLILILSAISCKNSVTGPAKVEDVTPGRRDYTWTVDTLIMHFCSLNALWGSSPNDIWASGLGGGPPVWLLHYDGKKWTQYLKHGGLDCEGWSLFGFSQNDVWLGSQDGEIYHYNGIEWSKNFTYKLKEKYKDIYILSFYGDRPDDLYACGAIFYKSNVNETESQKGFILHYDGHSWSEVCKGEFNSQFLTIRKSNNKVFVLSLSIGLKSSAEDIITIFELNGNSLKKVYSNNRTELTWGNFDFFGDELRFWIGRDVFVYNYNDYLGKGNLKKRFSINEPNYNYYIFGRNDKDVFISEIGGLAHYNGTDTQYLLKYPVTQYI